MSYNQELEDRIDHHYIAQKELIKNKQMGGVGWLINGNMCCGIFEDLLVVRIDPEYVEFLIDKAGIKYFVDTEDQPQNILSLESNIYKHPKALRKFLTHAREFTASLPPKDAAGQSATP